MQLRTTVRLEESILEQAKAEAARQNTTLTSLIERGLLLAMKESQEPRKKYQLPISTLGGGTWPGIDISNSADLLDIMDGLVDPSRR